MEHEQQEMIPKSPRDRALALKNWVVDQQLDEQVSFGKKIEKHDNRMFFLEKRLEDAEAVLRTAPDADGVVGLVTETAVSKFNKDQKDNPEGTIAAARTKIE